MPIIVYVIGNIECKVFSGTSVSTGDVARTVKVRVIPSSGFVWVPPQLSGWVMCPAIFILTQNDINQCFIIKILLSVEQRIMQHGVANFILLIHCPTRMLGMFRLIPKAHTHTHTQSKKWLGKYGLSCREGLCRIIVSKYFLTFIL